MTKDQPTLLLIDGHSLAFRAFYALNPDNFKNQQGQHTNAVHGFISMMLSILENEKPTHLCVAFDVSRESFRTKEYPEYKATRGETPEEFIGQTELLVEALAAMRITSVSREDYEADDLIASLARQGENEGFRVLVVSGDRDTFQLISDNTTILYPIKGVMNLARMDDAAVLEKYGVSSKQYQDLAALVGETSDNLPGIPGVGPKTAAKWLQQYGDLDGVLRAASEITGKVGETLREKSDLAVRNRRLNNLVVLKLRGTNGRQIPVPKAVIEEEEEPELQPVFSDLPTEQPEKQIASVGEIAKVIGPDTFVEVQISENKIVGFGVATLTKRLEWDGKNPGEVVKLLTKGGFGTWDSKQLARSLSEINVELGEVSEDALLEAYLVDPTNKDYSTDSLIQNATGIDVLRQDDNELFSESDASLDAWCYALIHKAMSEELADQGAKFVYRSIELPAAKVLSKMEITGIAVDQKNLKQQHSELSNQVDQLAQEAYKIIGHEVNLASPLLDAVEMDGRIHTSYLQTGTSTGRLSSESPNLQNIPIKSERGQKLRSAFVAGSGFTELLTADYSQIEMRIMAHLSEDEGLIEAFRAGEDLHNFVGARIYGVKPSEVTSAMRSKVKAMSYGLVYGLSEFGLARQLKITKTEAKQLMSDYFERFGGVKTYLDEVVQRAKQVGYTETVYGRRRPFSDLNSKIFQVRENARRAALNAPIQGTAADIMKLAMIEADRQISLRGLSSRLLLQVHDELVFEVAPGELEQVKLLAVESMKSVAKLSVPVEVHVGVGPNWELAGH